MAYRASDASYPPVQPSTSRESFTRPSPSSRISSVSDLSSSETLFGGLYDPEYHGSSSWDFISPPTSLSGLESRGFERSYQDGVDISHVRITSPSAEPLDQQRHFNAASARVPQSPRSRPPESPSTASNRSRFSWRPIDHYEPLSPVDTSFRTSTGLAGRLRSIKTNTGRRQPRHKPIPEEADEMDMGLIGNANRFGRGGTAYSTVGDENEQEEGFGSLGVDISSFTGPMGPRDEATMLEYRRLEAKGQLTGGLGSGLKPEVTINSKDLYASVSPASPLEMSRKLSRRGPGLARAPTLRDLGQRAANKHGKIIEVVVEDTGDKPGSVDLSLYTGDNTPSVEFDPLQNRQSAFKPTKVVTYYPQPNWKPHSMRWPYLTALTTISITLAVAQEILYQKSSYLSQLSPPSGLFEFTTAEELSTWDYFSFKYLPTMIAVIYGILWQVTDYEVKRLEPYYRLSKEGGALAAESINVDYVTIFNIFRPFRALRYRHYAVAVSSVATIFAVSLVPTLQSASVILEPDRDSRFKNPNNEKFINIHPIWSRVLTGVLGVISLLGFILLFQLQRRRSGLAGDVKGIAGIAALATKSHVLMDFKDLDTVPPQDIHNKLKDHRYALRNSSLTPDDAVPVTREDKDKYDRYRLSANPHPLMLRVVAGVPFIVSMIAFALFIPVVIFTPADVILDKAPWLLTALAVAIKLAFQTLEQDARMMEPFYRLSCRHAPPKVLTLDYTSMAFGYMPIRATINGDYLLALVGFGSVLAEILTVCVTSFAGVSAGFVAHDNIVDPIESSAETPTSFWVSFSLSLGILMYLIITASLVYMLRRHPFLPRQPSTIASVLAFIHQSKMLYDFVAVRAPHDASSRSPPAESSSSSSLARAITNSTTYTSPDTPKGGVRPGIAFNTTQAGDDQDLLVRRLAGMGKTYGLGWFTGRDGETHCGVDQEELNGSYKHRAADDARKATKPWLSDWAHY